MSLNPKERLILQLIAEGKRDKEIARVVHKSPSCVKQTVCKALVKLGANTRAQAVAMMMKEEI